MMKQEQGTNNTAARQHGHIHIAHGSTGMHNACTVSQGTEEMKIPQNNNSSSNNNKIQ
jgi:hypothetical protein